MKWVCLALFSLFTVNLSAQEYIEITGSNYSLVSIGPGQGASEPFAADVLKLLNWSGIFELKGSDDATDLTLSYTQYPDIGKLQIHGIDGLVFYTGVVNLPLLGAAEEARKQAAEITKALTGEHPKFNSAIVYGTNSPMGGHQLVMTDFLGIRQRTLLADGKIAVLPRWNPQSNAVAFTYLSDFGVKGMILSLAGEREVIRQKAGTTLESIFTKNRDKMLLNLSVKGNSDFYWYNRRESSLRRLTRRSSLEASPDIDKSGERMLFVSDRSGSVQIYQKEIRTGQTWRMTFEGKYNAEPAWSPTGKFFAFSSLVKGRYQVFLMDVKGRMQRQLSFGEGSNEQPRFSPDGRQILYVHKQKGIQKLYLMRTDGSFVRRLTQSPPATQEYNPDWSDQEIRW